MIKKSIAPGKAVTKYRLMQGTTSALAGINKMLMYVISNQVIHNKMTGIRCNSSYLN